MQLLAVTLCALSCSVTYGFRPVVPMSLGFSRLSAANAPLRMTSTALTSSSASPALVVADKVGGGGFWNGYVKTMDTLTTLFPLWTVLFATLALKR
jgi:hypothetical protein